MPRCVRNFWIDGSIDGRETWLSGGPKSKSGGMRIQIFQRDEGGIEEAVRVRCWESGGKLITVVDAKVPGVNGYEMREVARYETKR